MSTAASFSSSAPTRTRRPALRSLAFPNEHGGWGFLLEPIVLAMLVRPSWNGALVALAFTFGFMTRQPLRLALQDAVRGRSYPRTAACWWLATGYASLGVAALAAAIALSSWAVLIPLGLVAPLGLTQILYDAYGRNRRLLPELAGAAAMTSSAAAIALAAGMRMLPAFALSGIILARVVPTILLVRTLLRRSHGQDAATWPALASHAIAIPLVALFASKVAVFAMCILFARATWLLARETQPAAKTIGWSEIAFGTFVVICAAI